MGLKYDAQSCELCKNLVGFRQEPRLSAKHKVCDKCVRDIRPHVETLIDKFEKENTTYTIKEAKHIGLIANIAYYTFDEDRKRKLSRDADKSAREFLVRVELEKAKNIVRQPVGSKPLTGEDAKKATTILDGRTTIYGEDGYHRIKADRLEDIPNPRIKAPPFRQYGTNSKTIPFKEGTIFDPKIQKMVARGFKLIGDDIAKATKSVFKSIGKWYKNE